MAIAIGLLAAVAVAVVTAMAARTSGNVPGTAPPRDTAVADDTSRGNAATEDMALALDRLNTVRGDLGLSLVSEDPTLSAHAFEAARYMVTNETLTHHPEPGRPAYTESAAYGASHSVLSYRWSSAAGQAGTATDAVNRLLNAPYHALAMLEPRLGDVGIGYHTDGYAAATAIDVMTNRESTNDADSDRTRIMFPTMNVPPTALTFDGETPNPLVNCPGYLPGQTGSAILFGAAVDEHASISNAVATLTVAGTATETCVITAADDRNGPYLSDNQIMAFPAQPLQAGITHTVEIRWTDSATGQPTTVQWTFIP
ncbi:MAG: CAP domain-containing protein [Acidimicrobiia bacterium]|nr:CAP domain-containing protein [Acidimicrobiia bacterium]